MRFTHTRLYFRVRNRFVRSSRRLRARVLNYARREWTLQPVQPAPEPLRPLDWLIFCAIAFMLGIFCGAYLMGSVGPR